MRPAVSDTITTSSGHALRQLWKELNTLRQGRHVCLLVSLPHAMIATPSLGSATIRCFLPFGTSDKRPGFDFSAP